MQGLFANIQSSISSYVAYSWNHPKEAVNRCLFATGAAVGSFLVYELGNRASRQNTGFKIHVDFDADKMREFGILSAAAITAFIATVVATKFACSKNIPAKELPKPPGK